MSRRVPEAALAVGVLLSATFVVFVVLVERERLLAGTAPLATLAVGVALLYPFAIWAVVHSADPTWALPPRIVAAAATVLALIAVAVGVLRSAPMFGVSVALLVVLPPLAYWLTAAETSRVRSRPLVAVAGAAAFGIVCLGVAEEAPLIAAVDALPVLALAVAYHVRVDGRPLPREPTFALAGGGVLAVVGLAVALDASTYALVAGASTVGFGSVLSVYVTVVR